LRPLKPGSYDDAPQLTYGLCGYRDFICCFGFKVHFVKAEIWLLRNTERF